VKVVPKFQDESDEEEGRCNDLHDQLITSPETRFHAVHMFLRYFAAMNLGKFDDDKDQILVVWDLALSALALSVKVSSMYFISFRDDDLLQVHRDFLGPLRPVKAIDFLLLASHNVSFEDLEVRTTLVTLYEILTNLFPQAGQKDILEAFRLNLGDTPQCLIDDLWKALPSLREMHPDPWWNIVQRELWMNLFDMLLSKPS
jgi:hypothetical protein